MFEGVAQFFEEELGGLGGDALFVVFVEVEMGDAGDGELVESEAGSFFCSVYHKEFAGHFAGGFDEVGR